MLFYSVWTINATVVVSSSDSEGHVSSEGEAEPELSGTVCPTAGFLSGVRHGEVAIVMTSFPPCGSGCVFMLLLFQTQEEGPTSGAFILSNPVTPALQAFPRVTNTYGSYQVTNASTSHGTSHTDKETEQEVVFVFPGCQHPVPSDLWCPFLRHRLSGLLYPTNHHAPLCTAY